MKKGFIAGLSVLVVVLAVFRQRLFVRDPIAKVERSGLRQPGYRVYLNYYNDILVEDTARDSRMLVQAKGGVPLEPGVPAHLTCLRGLACLTEMEYAPTLTNGGGRAAAQVAMTSAFVTYVDGDGASIRVELR